MEVLASLWLPVLLAALFVFVASSLIHMLTPMHKGDYCKVPGEEQLRELLRAQGLKPGDYCFPRADSMKEMGSPEMVARYQQGPNGLLRITPPGPPAMGKALVQWFFYAVLIGILAGYTAAVGFGRGAEFLPIFRVTSTAAILAYAIGAISESIWKGQKWSVTAKFMIDGAIYGVITGATFGWLWPE